MWTTQNSESVHQMITNVDGIRITVQYWRWENPINPWIASAHYDLPTGEHVSTTSVWGNAESALDWCNIMSIQVPVVTWRNDITESDIDRMLKGNER